MLNSREQLGRGLISPLINSSTINLLALYTVKSRSNFHVLRLIILPQNGHEVDCFLDFRVLQRLWALLMLKAALNLLLVQAVLLDWICLQLLEKIVLHVNLLKMPRFLALLVVPFNFNEYALLYHFIFSILPWKSIAALLFNCSHKARCLGALSLSLSALHLTIGNHTVSS